MTDAGDVQAANAAFYEAIEAADLDALGRLWVEDRPAVCVHPGMAPILGHKAVLRSWAAMLAATPYLQFVLTDIAVEVRDGVGVVTCTENLLSAAEGMPDTVFAGGHAVATNVYGKDGNAWRLWVHHASPVRRRDGDPGGDRGRDPGGDRGRDPGGDRGRDRGGDLGGDLGGGTPDAPR